MTPLHNCQLLVMKVGTSLMRSASGAARTEWMASVAHDIARMRQAGTQVVVVSSGAVGFGRALLGYGDGALDLVQKQAASAAGQPHLMAAWQHALEAHGMKAAQILLTLDDAEERRRYLNARSTLRELLGHGIIPIVNENDTVATAELRVGDNDRLAARVAAMIGADCLLLLSDVDGLYTHAPSHPDARHVPRVDSIDATVLAMASGAASSTASGGMRTKLDAAQIAMQAGCATIIASGVAKHPIHALSEGAAFTQFVAATTPLQARKQWIAGSLHVAGKLHVDAGATEALRAGKSLLPVGVTRVEGSFGRGDAVAVCAPDGKVIAKGLSAYDHDEAVTIAGRKTHEIAAILGYEGRDNIIHRDDLVME